MNQMNFKAMLVSGENDFIKMPVEVMVTNWEASTAGGITWATVRQKKLDGEYGVPVTVRNPMFDKVGLAPENKEEIEDGSEHVIWQYNHRLKEDTLMNATLFSCELCGKPAYINGTWLTSTGNSHAAITRYRHEANKLNNAHGKITELLANDDGDSFCETCYYARAMQERV